MNLSSRAAKWAEISRIMERLGTKSTARVLSALGHPGYGEAFAEAALQRWVRSDGDLHSAVYWKGGGS